MNNIVKSLVNRLIVSLIINYLVHFISMHLDQIRNRTGRNWLVKIFGTTYKLITLMTHLRVELSCRIMHDAVPSIYC